MSALPPPPQYAAPAPPPQAYAEPVPPPQEPAAAVPSVGMNEQLAQLKQLGELLSAGVLTQAEFEQQTGDETDRGILGDLETAIRRELGADRIPPKSGPSGDDSG